MACKKNTTAPAPAPAVQNMQYISKSTLEGTPGHGSYLSTLHCTERGSAIKKDGVTTMIPVSKKERFAILLDLVRSAAQPPQAPKRVRPQECAL
jgi:hypothetical protein